MNIGDLIYQLFAFMMLLSIPAIIITVIVLLKGRKSRWDRLEQKVDQLLAQKEEK